MARMGLKAARMRTPTLRAAKCPFGGREAGFTTIELVVVLTILAVVYALATPLVAGRLDGPRLKQAASDITSALRAARATAVTQSRPITFEIMGQGAAWRIDDRNASFNDHIRLSLRPVGGRVELRRGGVTFFSDGGSTGGALTIRNAKHSRVIQIDWLTGRVTSAR